VKLGVVGLQYQRRLIANRHLVWSYGMEFRPVIIESNPTATDTDVVTFPGTPSQIFPGTPEATAKCVPAFVTFPSSPAVETLTQTCSREITYAQGFFPFGMKLNLRTRSRLQPTLSSYEGYILSTRPVPTASAGSFNFNFEIGAGLEYYRSRHSSVRVEYQVQHFSNHGTATQNPGVDNGLVKLTYSFGR
jgi:hypothetical protein